MESALNLAEAGRFIDALRSFEVGRQAGDSTSNQVLKAELQEVLGRHTQARLASEQLLRTAKLTLVQRAACETVIARVLLENGQTDRGIDRLLRAASTSQKSGDLQQLCRIQSKLVGVLAERSGPDAATPLVAELHRNITRLGDPRTTSVAHMFVAEMEARQGNLVSARRHVLRGQELLESSPSVWVEALAENVLLAISVLQSRVDEARIHSARALRLSDECGAAAARRSASANTGNLHFLCGEFELAFEFLQKALGCLPSGGERNNGILDALAQVRLAQDRFEECDSLLRQIDSTITDEKNRTLYAHRYAELTRTRLLMRIGSSADALRNCDYVLQLAKLTGDRMLSRLALVTRAQLLQRTGESVLCSDALLDVLATGDGCGADILAGYEGVIAGALTRDGASEFARSHWRRSQRLCGIVKNVPRLLDLQQHLGPTFNETVASPIEPVADGRRAGARNVLHCLTTAILQTSRPELVAGELAETLFDSGCVTGAIIDEVCPGGSKRQVMTIGVPSGESSCETRLLIGPTDMGRIELIVWTCSDLESMQTLGLFRLLLERFNELQIANEEKARRTTLWPNHEPPACTSNAVISGHMRELMSFAQRVARTTVNVLITGPSGTGKEILARAIHDFSDRAQKPFVPFNCAAIPRELLESQLFGHRRGAFTGAERDQLGLIRAAADGTLFLDEIGEMSLDLQPKLLRFLESGEISPLGEPSPLAVNVRVVAATNANLEDAVRDGKFREDLFYRLNVVRLSIKPLRERRDEIPGMVAHFVAAAAREYQKGHLQVAEDTMERLLLYRWPGNVRQLHNEVRRMVALAEPNSTLEPDSISADILNAMPNLHATGMNGREIAVSLHEKLLPTLSRIEAEMIKAALREHHGKVETAARSLGISRKGLYLKRQRLGL